MESVVEGIIFDPISLVKIPGRLFLFDSKIERIERDENITGPIILPGFVDSHIHIESSMLTPKEFARVAITHGTVAVVADPHEVANVAGVAGIDFMIKDSKDSNMKFYFGAPSCVPASPFDDCFKVLNSDEIDSLLQREDIHFLGEMMNFPGVVYKDEDVIRKIELSKKYKKPIDGHAPGLSSKILEDYVNVGITTDHECFTIEEAEEKIALGVKVLIREGSAAKNFSTLHPLIAKFVNNVMFCTDDCHPDDLLKGHMNLLVKRSVELGYDIFDILQVVAVNPVKHYKLNVGLLQPGDPADFILVDNLKDLNVLSTFIDGTDVLLKKTETELSIKSDLPNFKFVDNFNSDLIKLIAKSGRARVIEALDGELITNSIVRNVVSQNNFVESDLENDILKVVVVNRYKENEVFIGLINGFGIRKGAIAESIAHDSHHIIAVGADDESILKCINYIIAKKGGICYFDSKNIFGISLPVYGLMSNDSAKSVAGNYSQINSRVINDGCKLKAPFMTLSFMALTVIPKLKISPRGLFDIDKFNFVDLFV
ncbi:MAG: adenine deaminase [Tenuifilaceae bacterium]